MKTFLIVLNLKTLRSMTYAVRPDCGPGTGRETISGKLAAETVKTLAKNLGLKAAYTPKVIQNTRIYLAVEK